MRAERAAEADKDDWIALRAALWPEAQDHAGDLARMLAAPERFITFIAREDGGVAVGFAEVSLRHDYVSGCESSPVGFLEGIYVVPERRRQGVARALNAAAEQWARVCGCSEFASDALLDNIDSHRMHAALGFEETERIVGFRKLLRPVLG
jgi:aminoglycoside 6'-N-acetyltransferase I